MALLLGFVHAVHAPLHLASFAIRCFSTEHPWLAADPNDFSDALQLAFPFR